MSNLPFASLALRKSSTVVQRPMNSNNRKRHSSSARDADDAIDGDAFLTINELTHCYAFLTRHYLRKHLIFLISNSHLETPLDSRHCALLQDPNWPHTNRLLIRVTSESVENWMDVHECRVLRKSRRRSFGSPLDQGRV